MADRGCARQAEARDWLEPDRHSFVRTTVWHMTLVACSRSGCDRLGNCALLRVAAGRASGAQTQEGKDNQCVCLDSSFRVTGIFGFP